MELNNLDSIETKQVTHIIKVLLDEYILLITSQLNFAISKLEHDRKVVK